MRLVYGSKAIQDLIEILAYLESDSKNPERSQQVGQRLKEILNRLIQFPNLGKAGRVFGTRELITPKIGALTYLVVY